MPNSREVAPPSARQIEVARAVVAEHLPASPLILAPELGEDVWLKLESLQPTGSFKVRGALAATGGLGPGSRVVTASAGNHALALTWAAAQRGFSPTLVVPDSGSPAKIAKLKDLGADLRLVEGNFDDAERHAIELASAEDTPYVSAYNDTDVMAGQASLGAEVHDVLQRSFRLVVPVGGGGLGAGLALWAAGAEADVELLGVEPAVCAAVAASVGAGRVVPDDGAPTIADGLAGGLEPGTATLQPIAEGFKELVTVEEAEIEAAMAWLQRTLNVRSEGAGAIGVAAVRGGAVRTGGRATVVIITGRNVAQETLDRVLEAHE